MDLNEDHQRSKRFTDILWLPSSQQPCKRSQCHYPSTAGGELRPRGGESGRTGLVKATLASLWQRQELNQAWCPCVAAESLVATALSQLAMVRGTVNAKTWRIHALPVDTLDSLDWPFL